VGTTLAVSVKEKLQVFRQALFQTKAATKKCQDEIPAIYEEWFDKPGEVDTLEDI